MRALAALTALLALAGCAAAPCNDYLRAQQDCYDTLGESNFLAQKNAYCRDFTAQSDPYFDCLAEAYTEADCSTEAGFDDAIAQAAACSQE
ncbi:MAG: hypothetical protein ACI8S6_000543 [Myxococcota bacterium]|jgi:hypothetical protein